jgi:hypothetical protein
MQIDDGSKVFFACLKQLEALEEILYYTTFNLQLYATKCHL